MSHFRERKEKNCLNCQSQVLGKYCHVCGQENIEPVVSAWHLVKHFFNDITHFDGKFFGTLKTLITRPGHASKEYMLGRRMSYLDPIRMYIFTSAFFFLVFFSLHSFESLDSETKINKIPLSAINAMDSTAFSNFTKDLNDGVPLTRDEFSIYLDTTSGGRGFRFTPNDYKTKSQYDSALKAGKDHNWLERKLTYRQIELNEKYGHDRSRILSAFINALTHTFPQMLFVSLPLFALMLKLLYVRKKQFYYASHIIFSFHLYIFIFMMLFLMMMLGELRNLLHWNWLNIFQVVAYLGILFYEYKAMRNFYGQSRGKTVLKFLLLNIMLFFLMVILFVAFSFFSLLKM